MQIGLDIATGPDITTVAEYRIFAKRNNKAALVLYEMGYAAAMLSITMLRFSLANNITPPARTWHHAIAISQGKRKHWLRREAARRGVTL